MKPSQLFFDLVEAFEGLRLTAYKDKGGVWTIGYGTTRYPDGRAVIGTDTCTIEQACEYLLCHVNGEELPALEQHQYDACLDFIYEEGQSAFDNSTLKKSILNGADGDTITKDFCMWDEEKINGKEEVIGGILRRRKCEAYLFNNGVNHPTFFE